MAVQLPEGKQSFTTATGAPGVGYKLYTYIAGTSTPKDTYTTSTASVANTNPVIADARGEMTVYWVGTYDVILKDAADVTIWGPERLETPSVLIDAGDALIRSDLANTASAPLGDFLVGSKQSGTGSVPTTVHAKLGDTMHLTDKGTVADMLTALNSVASDLNGGGKCIIQNGTWVLSDTFTFAGQGLHLEGNGRYASVVSFAPASTKAALVYNAGGGGGINQTSIRRLGFTAGANTQIKTAISLVNAAECEIADIGIPDGVWLGASIGVATFGRQFVYMHDCVIVCQRPVVIGSNASFSSLSSDHFTFERNELVGKSSAFPVIEFVDGTSFSNTTVLETSVNGGGHGLYWNDTTSTAASFSLKISGFRSEQGLDATKYSIYLASTAQALQQVIIENAKLDNARNGIFLRNCQRVTIRNCSLDTTTGTALDMTFVAGSRLILENCLRPFSGAITLTNARLVSREDNVGFGIREEYAYDSGFNAASLVSDVYHGGSWTAIANDALLAIADNTFTGFVLISASEDVCAIYMLMGLTQSTQEVADTAGFFSPTVGTASSYNVYWNAGTSRYVIQNKRGATVNVSVYKIGTAN